MKRQGFTLIELLAVIVVLAIIALIATPIVMNTIESSKKGATIESVRNMVHAAELYFISENPRYGKLNLLDDKLDYDGQKPELGEVEVNKNGDSRVYAYINGYCVTKEYDSELYASKTNKEECNWYATDNYETTEGTVLTLNNQKIKNYLIYGNSTQAVNLYDYNNVPVSLGTKQDNGYFVSSSNNIKFYTYKTLENYIGKTVTISFDLTTSEDGSFRVYQYQNNGIGIEMQPKERNISMQANTKKRISITGVVKELGTKEDQSKGEIIIYKSDYTGSYLVNNIQFEFGTNATTYEKYGLRPSPEYPSEIKSTGDLITKDNCASYGNDACNNVGKYVVQLKATGKNIFDANGWYSWLRTFTTHYVTKETVDGIEAIRYQPQLTYNKPWMKGNFKKNTKYIFSYRAKGIVGTDRSTGFRFIYTDGTTTICYVDNEATWKNYTCASNGKTIDHLEMNYFYGQGCYFDINSMQLEEGTSATTYEPYKDKLTNIYLTEPLRKVGDYADYIDYNNKKIVRNVKEIVYTGKESWLADNGDASYAFDSTEPYIKKSKGLLFSNIAFYTETKDDSKFSFKSSGAGYIEFNAFGKGYTSTTWKQYLANKYNSGSPVKVQYDIATPIEQTIDLPSIELLDGYNTLSINTEVSPSNVKLTTSK